MNWSRTCDNGIKRDLGIISWAKKKRGEIPWIFLSKVALPIWNPKRTKTTFFLTHIVIPTDFVKQLYWPFWLAIKYDKLLILNRKLKRKKKAIFLRQCFDSDNQKHGMFGFNVMKLTLYYINKKLLCSVEFFNISPLIVCD